MKIAFHEESELLKWKISNYESYEYSKLLECPECGNGTEFPYGVHQVKSILVGWCETPQGFMFVKECPVCGTRYRFHGVTTERNDYYRFLENFSLHLYMIENKDNYETKNRT